MKKYIRLLLTCSFSAVLLLGTSTLRAELTSAKALIKAVNGKAVWAINGGAKPVRVGDAIKAGAVIETKANSTVDLVLQDSGTVLRMLPETTLSFPVLDKHPAGEQVVTKTSLKLLKGSIIGAQRKLAVPSHFDIATADNVATIVGTEYVINANGAVTVLDGAVSINYNLPHNGGSVNVTIPQGSTFDPATGKVVPTSSQYLQNIIADVNTVKQNAQVFKAGGATIVVKPENYISPTHPDDGQEHGQGQDHGHGNENHGDENHGHDN